MKISGERDKELDADNHEVDDHSVYVTRSGELQLSNPGQLELLLGMKERGVSLRTSVRGFSMHPFIMDQDVLIISPLNEQDPRLGEVVAFKHPKNGRLVIHRIIKRTNSGWMVRGDNCPQPDGVVNLEQILARVTGVERNGRRVSFGLGVERLLIAFINRRKGLYFIKQAWLLPRRSAGLVLRKVQGLSAYRLLGRRLALPVVITQAEDCDMEEMHRHLNPSMPYHRQPSSPNVINLIARHKGKAVGFAQLVYHPENHYPWTGYWLFSLYVWSLYRGLGIGEKLVRRHIEEAKKLGTSEILLTVYEDNKKAIELNRKLGYKPIVMPALEPLLAEEKEKSGRRRIIMKKLLR